MPTIYLGSVGSDLRRHRDAVFSAVSSLEGFEIRRIEDFGSSTDFDPGVLRHCQAYVGLIGNRYGVPVSAAVPSFPEFEYEAARSAGISLLLFAAPEDRQILADEGELESAQRAFRQRVVRQPVEEFTTPQDAADRVVARLLRWQQEREGGSDEADKAAWESILPANVGDQAAEQDALGFEPYVRALAEFLTDPRTRPPLTLSVEGEWGSGKTSFMLQLKGALGEARKKRATSAAVSRRRLRNDPPLTVWFNAWRHDQAREMWAAFAVEFARQVAEQQPRLSRWRGHLTLLRRRFNWRQGFPHLLRYLGSWILIVGLTVALPVLACLKGPEWVRAIAAALSAKEAWKNGIEVATALGGTVGYAILLLTVWLRLKSFLGSPVEFDLKEHLRSPDYQESLAFIERFHSDFRHVVEAYAGRETVYVFIDDVDRCDVPKAAELMEGLNLMTSGDLRIVTIVGMDREKVAAGLAVKHEKLLPYLYEVRRSEAGGELRSGDRLRGLEFGYEFIEKFIQVPFLVPRPREEDLTGYMGAISESGERWPAAAGTAGRRRRIVDWVRRRFRGRQAGPTGTPAALAGDETISASGGAAGQSTGSQAARREVMKVRASEDSATVREIVLAVAPALGHNPRRLKQFLNLFRLRTFIAAETGLFDLPDGAAPEVGLTLQQLGKFVALGLRWPLLLTDLGRRPGLLSALQARSVGVMLDGPAIAPPFPYWSGREDLLTFLRFGCSDAPDPARWSLEKMEVARMLQVSPRVRSVERGPAAVETPEVLSGSSLDEGSPGTPPPPAAPPEPPGEREAPVRQAEEPVPAQPMKRTPPEGVTTSRAPANEEPQEYDAYASYDSRDRREVLWVLRQLAAEGLRIWSDTKLRPGDEWQLRMTEILETVPVLLMFVGPFGFSPWQEKELNVFLGRASSEGRRVIPVLLPSLDDDSKVPESLRQFQWVDLRSDADSAIEQLALALGGPGAPFQSSPEG